MAALGWNIDPAVDPTAVVVASRRADEPWFCLEQPDRGSVARAALGCVAALEASGPERFRTVATRWRELAAQAVCEPDDGLAALGGFAFAPDGGSIAAVVRVRRRPRCTCRRCCSCAAAARSA